MITITVVWSTQAHCLITTWSLFHTREMRVSKSFVGSVHKPLCARSFVCRVLSLCVCVCSHRQNSWCKYNKMYKINTQVEMCIGMCILFWNSGRIKNTRKKRIQSKAMRNPNTRRQQQKRARCALEPRINWSEMQNTLYLLSMHLYRFKAICWDGMEWKARVKLEMFRLLFFERERGRERLSEWL